MPFSKLPECAGATAAAGTKRSGAENFCGLKCIQSFWLPDPEVDLTELSANAAGREKFATNITNRVMESALFRVKSVGTESPIEMVGWLTSQDRETLAHGKRSNLSDDWGQFTIFSRLSQASFG